MLRLCTQRVFDGGRPGADCLTPQLRTNGHLATDYKRNLSKSVAYPPGYATCGEDRKMEHGPPRGQPPGFGDAGPDCRGHPNRTQARSHAWRIRNDWRIIAL